MDENNEMIYSMAELITDIIAERERLGITQSRLAEMAGVKQSAISRMESLKAMPQLNTLLKILKPLNLKLTIGQIEKIEKIKELKKMKTERINKIFVETHECNIKIEKSCDNEVHFITEKEKEFTTTESEGVLTFKQKKRNLLKHLFIWLPIEVTIQIPDDYNGDMDLRNRNGRLNIQSVKFNNIIIDNNNGAMFVDNLSAENIDLQNGNGKIIMNFINADELTADSSNGRVEGNNIFAKNSVKMTSSNGRLIVKEMETLSLKLRSSNGSILLSEVLVENIEAKTSNGKILIDSGYNEADFSVDLTTTNGSVTVADRKVTGGYIIKNGSKNITARTSNGKIGVSFKDSPVRFLSGENAQKEPEDTDVFGNGD